MSKKISQLEELIEAKGSEHLVLAWDDKNYRLTLRKAGEYLKTLLSKEDVGLGNVDNTSDIDKPISTATQQALDNKAPLIHNHPEYVRLGLTEW